MAQSPSSGSASFSIPSIIALIAAIGSFMNGAILGMVLAVEAIVFGILGVVISLVPSRRGGIISTFGIGAGVIGIIAAVVKAVIWILS